MAQPPTPPQPDRGQPDRRALLEAFQQVVRDEKQKSAHPAAPTPAPARPTTRLILLALVAALSGVIVFRPRWLFPAPEPETPALQEASLRVRMYVELTRIERFKADSGRLPSSLLDAGADTTGLVYTIEGENFTLKGTNEGQSLTFHSGTDPRQFLGDSYRQIAARRKP